ncbi:hypothetical protein T07_10777 [Trichinella nelsoni]|uniref:Uncharacterized protein n=1 Tax=Trichinella nelsoni TaxID=6336 RepID=A0A0V0S8P9_9BILA|nr:hypothetical protein T07_10777 [Trichinella nelsoni]
MREENTGDVIGVILKLPNTTDAELASSDAFNKVLAQAKPLRLTDSIDDKNKGKSLLGRVEQSAEKFVQLRRATVLTARADEINMQISLREFGQLTGKKRNESVVQELDEQKEPYTTRFMYKFM